MIDRKVKTIGAYVIEFHNSTSLLKVVSYVSNHAEPVNKLSADISNHLLTLKISFFINSQLVSFLLPA